MIKRAAVINDLSGMGKCSLAAQIAVLSALGVQPCPVPTAVLSNQTEFEHYFSRNLNGVIQGFKSAWQKNGESFDGICTGYFFSAEQLDAALDFIKSFDALSVVDPVMGDDGALYPAYDRRCCEKMKALAAAADIITPNLTELCILTDSDYQKMKNASYEEIARLARQFKRAVITGIHSGDMLVNLVIEGSDTHIIKVKNAGGRFSGTGDIFTAALCGCLLRGKSLYEAAQIAADFILMSVAETVKSPYNPLYGINFEQQLSFLTEVIRNATE